MSERVQYHEEFVEIDGRVRIERGMPMKKAVATTEFLASDTFHHGAPGTAIKKDGVFLTPRHYSIGDRDAMYNVIVPGKEFHYIDWHSGKVFHVYENENDPTWNQYTETIQEGIRRLMPDTNHPQHNKRWVIKGEFKTMAEAEIFAATLLRS